MRRYIRRYIRFGHWTWIFGVVISNEWEGRTFDIGITESGIFHTNISTILALILPFFNLYLIPISLILCYYGFLDVCFRVPERKKMWYIYLLRKPLSIKYKL